MGVPTKTVLDYTMGSSEHITSADSGDQRLVLKCRLKLQTVGM